MSDLAIVIPAYKDTFLDKTLNSLSKQTNKDFTVYIGDDHSPANLLSIINNYKQQLTIHYTRFSNNIGAKNLVLQWRRCIELTKQESWLWLFSDDDLMDKNCVEQFYQTIKEKENAFDVYRFNTIIINKNDEVTEQCPIGPEIENASEMAYHLLMGRRGNSMPDHIFSRKIYAESGGFVFTDYAQGADWATSILFAQKTGICIIPDANVRWRYSGINISSTAAANKHSTINGHLQFITWILNHFEYLKTASSTITYEMMLTAAWFNLTMVLSYHYKGFNFNNTLPLINFYHKKIKLTYYDSFIELKKIKTTNSPLLQKYNRVIFRFKNKLHKIINNKKNAHL